MGTAAPGARRRVRPGACVFLLALLAHAWSIGLPFALDDYNILPRMEGFVELRERADEGAYFFRPTAWVIWGGLIKLGGGFASAPVFHGVLLVLHALTAWLLYRVLRSTVSERAAFAGGALFAILPGGIQAVTWIAAAGDQLAVLFLLCAALAAQRFSRTGALWTIPAIAVCAFLSFLAKETMVALAPAAALALWSVPKEQRHERRWWIAAAAAGAGVAAGILVRFANIGILGPAYAYEVSLSVAKIARVHEPLLQMLVPWNLAPAFEGIRPFVGPSVAAAAGADPVRAERIAVVGAFLVPIAIGILCDPKSVRRLLPVLAAFAIAFVPAIAAWHFGAVATNSLSRTFYGPLAIACVLLALAIDRIMSGLRPNTALRTARAIVVASLLLFALLEVDLIVHVARTELLVADRVRSRLASLEDVARVESPETHFLVVDPESDIGGLPALGPGVIHSLGPPFTRTKRAVSWWWDTVTLDRCPVLARESGPIRVLEVRDHRFVPLGEIIPPIPADVPPLAPVEGRVGTFEFPVPVATRAVAALRVRARRDDAAGAATCTWAGEHGTMQEPIVLPPGPGEVTAVAVPPRADARGWIPFPTIKGVSFSGITVIGVPEVVRVVPEIRTRMATPPPHIVMLGQLPEIMFTVPFDSPRYLITFDFMIGTARLPMVYSVARERLQKTAEREYRFVPAPGDSVSWPGHAYHVTWQDVPEAFRRELLSRGQHQVPVQFRVQGVGGDGMPAEAESTWDTLTLWAE